MADPGESAELAHNRHTAACVAEIKALIEEHEKLLGELQRQRHNAPTPPEPHPSLVLQGKRVFRE